MFTGKVAVGTDNPFNARSKLIPTPQPIKASGVELLHETDNQAISHSNCWRKMTMRAFTFLLIAAAGWPLLTIASRAQGITIITNAPKTRIEAFEAQTGTVIIKASGQTGTIALQAGVVSVICKESTDVTTGRKEYGIAVEVMENNRPKDTTIIDYDEIDPLLNAIGYIGKVNYTVTSLPGFDAVYTTRGGLRIATYSSRKRVGTLGTSLQSSTVNKVRVSLSPEQLAQFQSLLQQSKTTLDSLRAGK